MAIQIIKKSEQAFGSFNNGKIIENKPIGFPQDRGITKPYSNLFYWANASSENGGLIDEHPHKWFEIITFILEGEIEHFDNKYNRWLKLSKGDAQIIRAGNGITHAEKMLPNSRLFQIWFDPNIAETQNKPASYNDYKAEEFIAEINNHSKTTFYSGTHGKIKMDSLGIEIKRIELKAGNHQLNVLQENFTSIYILKSEGLTINRQQISTDDFIIANDENPLLIQTEGTSTLFIIENKKILPYTTYTDMVKFKS